MTGAKHGTLYRIVRGTASLQTGCCAPLCDNTSMVTNASLVRELDSFQRFALLTSSWHFGVAPVRRVPFKSTRRPRSVLSASDNPIEPRAFGELRTVVNVVARSAYGIAWTTNSWVLRQAAHRPRPRRTPHRYAPEPPAAAPCHEPMLAVLDRLGYGHVTVHGFRFDVCDLGRSCTDYPDGVREAALAHKYKSETTAAYQRGQKLEKRRALMKD